MNYSLIDTHCHLDIIESQGQDIATSLEKSSSAGVKKIVQIGINLDRSIAARKIALETKTNIELSYTIGCHPADNIDLPEIEDISKFIEENKDETSFVGIGEIGLDYYHKTETKESQIKTFHHFMEMSVKYALPVIIHSRDAAEDTYQILKKYKDKAFGVIHCFTYDTEYALKYAELGYYISFSGVVAFKNAADIQEAARKVPLESILIETDAPFLSPPPHRGKRNDSSNLPFILEKMFSLRTEANHKVEEKIYENSVKFIHRKAV
ncbi:MAG TPA: TatD family hydrolase [Leptospiraceae bacterium]|nr:TatD family hydrolase [Leptospiraceae bacterium]HMX32194.1 TatD family hydrolase [Leptospiraceae bacterium]HMY33010.1 TatD family hydrolase [Leptospiraceae bacterium]HMZ63532.1 TatD family hydrolase [Leptospiraceae bacterium]HNA08311.1 TatD family hydrolase [Leptospiraceae bacterium]